MVSLGGVSQDKENAMRVHNEPINSARKIAIRFGDNDFYNCFTVLLKCLHEIWKWTGFLPKDKDKLCFAINNLSPTMYLLAQNTWEYNGLEDVAGKDTGISEEYEHIKKYLTIKPDRILIDEEVDKLVEEGDAVHCFNSEIFVLDTTLYNNNIYAL